MMVQVNQVLVEVLHIAERQLQVRALGGTQTTEPAAATAAQTASPSSTMSGTTSSSGGPTSSPLLFFVALGFGVVFTNLWIIVGVKYCFRYNARNRAIRNGEDPDPINLENMPTRPHRRRREKKLMSMEEVNDRFPLTKYKAWVASRAREGLSTSGGVTAPPSRAGSVRHIEGVIPSSPTDTKHSIGTRPNTSGSDVAPTKFNTTGMRKSMDVSEKAMASPVVEEQNHLETIHTTTSTVDKHLITTEEDDDEDDHIHTAVPPELLTNPGDSCAICIDTLEDDDDIRGLSCGHAFHAGCLDPWLTSRRACCPLCKADYYTPKPRPEGEADAMDRSGRRRDRSNMPQQPASAWTGIRGGPRLILPGRFGGSAFSGTAGDATLGGGRQETRAERREARRVATEQAQADATETGATTTTRRWNPFRRHQANAETPTDISPSQLEAGVVR